jgi:hypothetical protein
MAERTPGELDVRLDAIVDLLKDLQTRMVTKDLFDAWRDGNDARVLRLENDMKDWIRQSTEAHVSLDKDSKARHQEAETDLEAAVKKIENRLNETEKKNEQIERDQKAQKNSKVQGYTLAAIGAVLSVIGAIVTSVILNGLAP